MLLIFTVALILIGTISLIIGFLQSSLPPIYISLACSVLAGVLLFVFNRMTNRSQQVVVSEDGPAPLEPDDDLTVGVGADLGASYGSSSDEGLAPEATRATTAVAVLDAPFPIEGYDDLRVADILPLLDGLDLDELDLVREREEQGKNRTTVLARIDQRIDQLEAEEAAGVPSAADRTETVAIPVIDPGAPGDEGDGDDDDYFPILDYDELKVAEIVPLLPELDDDELEMVIERERAGANRSTILTKAEELLDGSASSTDPVPADAPPPAEATDAAGSDDDDDYFPILDYDELLVEEIVPVLDDLDDDELEMVRDRERAQANRKPILDEIATLLGEEADDVTFAAPVAAAPARKTPAKKAPAKKAPGKKAATKAAPAKKAPAKKAPTKRAATKAAPAAKKASAPAKKTATKAAAPAKKAAAAKKASAKKAPAKKTTKRS